MAQPFSLRGAVRRPYTIVALLTLHAAVLVLAATNYTVLRLLTGDYHVSFNYFQYSSQSGFGTSYVSEYSLLVVASYLLSYGIGAIAYLLGRLHIPALWRIPGLLLCAVGVISFGIEITHWFREHHSSWIVSIPLASLILASGGMVYAFSAARTAGSTVPAAR